MPRNVSGTYSLPLPPVVPNTTIDAVWANTTLNDIAQALTDSLDRYARGGLTAPLRLVDGTAPQPAWAFASETGTGMYRAAAGQLGVAVMGAPVGGWTSAGFSGTVAQIDGNPVFTGNRFLADFSNSDQAQRMTFQSNVTNGSTGVGAIPNGTATTAAWTVFNNSDPSNAAYLYLAISNIRAEVSTNKNGAGAYLPLVFNVAGYERYRLDPSLNRFMADFSNTTISSRFTFQTSTVNGATSFDICPNGTGTNSSFFAFGSAAVDNTSFSGFVTDTAGGVCSVLSSKTGTGTYLPLVFLVNNAERMRMAINGTTTLTGTSFNTPPAIEVGAGAEGTGNRAANIDFHSSDSVDYSFRIIREAGMDGQATLWQNAATAALALVTMGTGPIAFFTNNTIRGRFESTGELTLMTTGAEGGQLNLLRKNNAYGPAIDVDANENLRLVNTNAGGESAITFSTSGVERVRIGVDGQTSFGTSSLLGAMINIQYLRTTYHGLIIRPSADTGSGSPVIFFNAASSVVGYINTTVNSTSYNTSSDYRLKENLRAIVRPLDRLLRLEPLAFDWKVDGSEGEGFIAHELQTECPLAVTGEKDGEQMQGVDHSKLVPLLVAAVQELTKKVEYLEHLATVA